MHPKTILQAHLKWTYSLPPGWHTLYRRAAEALAEEAPGASLVDAKEKMGELRISIRGQDAQAVQIKFVA